MGNLVERFREVEQDGVGLSFGIQVLGQVVGYYDQLGLTGASLTKSVLRIAYDLPLIEVLSDPMPDHVLKELALYAG